MLNFALVSLFVVVELCSAHPGGWHPSGCSGSSGWNLKNFKSLVAFGNSYTDEGRLAYFSAHNGSAPPAGWIGPVSNSTSTGGYIWPRYVSWYSGATLYDYAVSGAVCSNEITPRLTQLGSVTALFPDIQGYEIPAFEADKAISGVLDIPADETVYAMWIGTNDLGDGAFLTDSQVAGKTIMDYIDCVFSAFDKLYQTGARYFVLMNVIPLNLTPLYGLPSAGGVTATKFWKNKPANITEISYRMMEQVLVVDDDFKYRTPFEVKIANKYPGASFAIFDVWSLINSIYHNPSAYLNGTAPLNVTGYINQCSVNGTNCVLASSPDSYLWYDELHPSEQTDRVIAKEFVKVVEGNSTYATYWS